MAFETLPVPRLARPLAPVDPYRHRAAYLRVLALLYHAEAAALEGFELLTDPAYVQGHELFARISRRLVADERRHLEDIERLVARLTPDGVPPPSPAEAEFWTAWRSGTLFALPYKPSIAALFCLFSEGLGFAFLHHLAEMTSDPDFKAALAANVEDEKMHLRLSLTVLKRAMQHDKRSLLADFVVYLTGYGLVARKPLREQRAMLEALGIDYDVLVGSSLRFVCELMQVVVDEETDPRLDRLLRRLAATFGDNPRAVRVMHLAMYLPEPPGARRLVYGWGRLGQLVDRRRAASTAPAEAEAA
ncbi:MAG: hypothetical protein R3F65_10870 [bacterium]|nr:hypothetical protein [Myxococcales bacterium]